jgi:hypothetical protein
MNLLQQSKKQIENNITTFIFYRYICHLILSAQVEGKQELFTENVISQALVCPTFVLKYRLLILDSSTQLALSCSRLW